MGARKLAAEIVGARPGADVVDAADIANTNGEWTLPLFKGVGS